MKIKVYLAVVITTLFYDCEVSPIHQRHTRKLISIKWQENIPDTEDLTEELKKEFPCNLKEVIKTASRHSSGHSVVTLTFGKLRHTTGVGEEPQSTMAPRNAKLTLRKIAI